MEIETKRLFLKKHEPQDFNRFWDMINDPVAKQYTGGVTQLNYIQRLEMFKKECSEAFSNNDIEFAVREKDSGKYLGYCGFRISAELGGNEFFYGYCRDCWEQGYGFEAADAVLRYLFTAFSHDSYIATADTHNIASVKILKKLGFKNIDQIVCEDLGAVDRYIIEKKDYLASL